MPAVLRTLRRLRRRRRMPHARRCADGDDWVINGQKVWTSGAQIADYGIVIARTDPDVPKHKGLTMFWIDMKTPGVEVRPIHQMSGGVELQRGVLHRRAHPRQPAAGRGRRRLEGRPRHPDERARRGRSGSGPVLARHHGACRGTCPAWDGTALKDPAFREKLADWYVEAEASALTQLPHPDRAVARADAGAGKLDRQDAVVRLAEQDRATALDMLRPVRVIDDPDAAPVKARSSIASCGRRACASPAAPTRS